MKLIASLLASAALSLATVAAHANTIAPGVTLNLSSGASNYTFLQTTPNTFQVADGLNVITASYINVPNVLDSFTFTDICVTVGLTPCKTYSLTIGDASAVGVSLGLGVSTAAQVNTVLTTNLATVKLDGSLGATAETINFALPSGLPPVVPPSASPVPEPATISRRRFRA